MLRGIADNTIIVGAYVDSSSGGICPMLAAHRNGGRTDLASFARSWDRYTDAREPRPATKREILTLVSLLESSLIADVSLAGVVPPAMRPQPTHAAPRVEPPERPGHAFRIRRLGRRHRSEAGQPTSVA